MKLEPLYELKERLEASAIAGVSLVAEDFRLARAIENMEPLAKASPVFDKIYKGAKAVVEASTEERAGCLLDVLALVNAVLTTQAVTVTVDSLEPIKANDQKIKYVEAPYSKMAPLLDALTTTGGGHYSYIVNAHDESPELFADYRVREALVTGLGAGYSELADLIKEWLKEEGTSIIPLLKKGFNPKGKKEMVRRLEVMEAIAGKEENDFYLSLLDEAEKEVKEAAVYALRHEEGNVSILTELTKTEKGNVKKKAILALARMQGTGNREFFEKFVQKNWSTAFKNFELSTNEVVADIVADEAQKLIDFMEEKISKGEYVLTDEEIFKVQAIFRALTCKNTDKIFAVFKRLAQVTTKVKQSAKNIIIRCVGASASYMSFTPGYVARMLTDSVLFTQDQKIMDFAYEMYREFPESFAMPALVTSLITESADKVYERFADVLEAKDGEKVGALSEKQVKGILDEIANAFIKITWDAQKEKYVIHNHCYTELDEHPYVKVPFYEMPDIRWFKPLINGRVYKKDIRFFFMCPGYRSNGSDWNDLLHNLIPSVDCEIREVLGEHFYNLAQNVKMTELYQMISPIRRCKIKNAKGLMIKAAKKAPCKFMYVEWVVENMPLSLEDKLDELRQLKELQEKKDIEILDYTEDRFNRLCETLQM